MEKGRKKITFLYKWQVTIKKGPKVAFALSVLFWKEYYVKNEWCKTDLQKTSTNYEWRQRIMDQKLPSKPTKTNMNCNRIWANQLLQESVLVGLILLRDSTEDVQGFS